MAGETAEDDDTDQDMEAGFNTETVAPPLKTEGIKEEPKPEPAIETNPERKEAKKPGDAKPQVPAKPDAQAPKYRQITEEEWTNLSASADKTASLEKQLSTVLGTVGNIKQLVTKLQTETPKGAQVTLPKGALKKLREEFPDMADLIEEDLNQAFQGMKGTGGETPTPSQTFSEEDFKTRLQAARLDDAREALEDEFPHWVKIVGEVDKDGKHDPKTPYRIWLAKQSVEYQQKINETNNPYVISRSIRLFKKETGKPGAAKPSTIIKPAKPSLRQAARTTRIQSAVPPKGAGGQTPSRNSADDEFEAGFASERGG